MANQETQVLDETIARSRRTMLTLGVASLAGLAVGVTARSAKAATVAYTDADILNFALNLEYLEANFYYLAAFGTTIDVANAASTAAGAPLITLSGSVGTAGTVSGGSLVPFTTIPVASYAIETAVEEGKHVQLLLAAIGSSAVAQPAINLGTSFQTLATAANIPGGVSFSPYASDDDFLVGAYVFEDVGVTAYHGAASLLTVPANLVTAAGILAVEAYHAGLIRTTINYLDPTGTSIGGYTSLISTLRASLSMAGLLGVAPSTYDPNPDDYGLANLSVSLGGGGNVTATRLTDADSTKCCSLCSQHHPSPEHRHRGRRGQRCRCSQPCRRGLLSRGYECWAERLQIAEPATLYTLSALQALPEIDGFAGSDIVYGKIQRLTRMEPGTSRPIRGIGVQ